MIIGPSWGKDNWQNVSAQTSLKTRQTRIYRDRTQKSNGSSPSPSVFADPWGWEITGSDDGKISPKDESKKYQHFFFSYLNHEIVSIWANEWMTELPPFKMGWKLYRRELWQVPSFMDHMLFFFPLLVMPQRNSSLLVSVHHWAYWIS